MAIKESHSKKKLIRTAAIPASFITMLRGQLRFLNNHYEVVGVASHGQQLQQASDEQGIRTIGVNIERSISPLKDLVSVFKLYRVFKKEKPFIVHSLTPKAGLLTMMAAYFARVPRRVHTFTGLLFPTQTGFMKRFLLFFDRLICFFATHVYPEGNGVKNDLENYKVTKKPLNVIANGNVNGIDIQYFDPSLFDAESVKSIRQECDLKDSDFVFVNIGRLVNDKGINELVTAFNRLTLTYKNIKLLLIGAHIHETDKLPKETWDIINGHEQIIYAGPQSDVRPFLKASDALVFPSYREGFPNVVLEAGAMGLPSIVTDINGCNEIIEHGKNGLIIPSKDEAALHQAMKIFVADKEMLRQQAEVARPMIVSRFERSLVWQALLAEYKKIEI